jgi:hypothetical protein
MKVATLHQKVTLDTGVIGELHFEGKVFQTLETQNCLKEGEHILKPKDGRYCIDDDYYVIMDRNSRYREKGLAVGYVWDFQRFDLLDKGNAMQDLLREVGDGIKIVVTRPDTKFKEKYDEEVKKAREAEAGFKRILKEKEKESADIISTLEKELDEVKAALKWAVVQIGSIKPASKTDALKTIDRVQGETNEHNRDLSRD